MKQFTPVALLVVGLTTGCMTTMKFDLSDPSDRKALTAEESVRIDLVDGSRIIGRGARVDSDSLFFAVNLDDNRPSSAALSDVAEISATRPCWGGIVALIGASIAVLFVSTAFFWGATFQD